MLEADGYQVVGEAQDGRSGIAAARALPPDIVLLDVHLPDLDGFEVAPALTCRDDAPVVVLTSSRDLGGCGSPRAASCFAWDHAVGIA